MKWHYIAAEKRAGCLRESRHLVGRASDGVDRFAFC